MNGRQDYLRAYNFRNPGRIPARYTITGAAWEYYGVGEMKKMIKRHGILFAGEKFDHISEGNIQFKPYRIKGVDYTDSWGCVWRTGRNGSTGVVVKHPLDDLSHIADLTTPDPDAHNGWEPIDWAEIAESVEEDRKNNRITHRGLRHGFFFLTMTYLRGFENLMVDIYDETPDFLELMDKVEAFNEAQVKRLMALNTDIMGFPEDLGSQDRLLISPGAFRKHIKPAYKRLMSPVREKGTLIHMHSDGHIMEIIDDLIECGVNIINLQDLVNGIDEIEREIKGRIAVDLDVDRQDVTVKGSPGDIDDLIREEVMKLGSPRGGLSLVYGLYPGTPPANAEAVMSAMEKYSLYYK